MEEDLTVASYVRETLNAGVNPLEMRFAEISRTYPPEPIAYRSFTYMNSVTTGVIGPEEYGPDTDDTEEGVKLAKWNIRQALRAARQMELAERKIDFITARCPLKVCLTEDLYETVKRLSDDEGLSPERICLEFPSAVLNKRPKDELEKVRKTFLDMKLLKVKTLVTGIGETPIAPAIFYEIPADFFLLDPVLTSMSNSRSKGTAVAAQINFLRSISEGVIADGVYNDDQIKALSKAGCWAYIPSSGYAGKYRAVTELDPDGKPIYRNVKLRMTLEEAIGQRAGEK